jgi:hypothetical protein
MISEKSEMIRLGADQASTRVVIRAIYGGMPGEQKQNVQLADYGVNAVFLHSDSITKDRVLWVKRQGAKIFAEFNTLHVANYVEDHPNAAPVGIDGKVSPPPHDWQGICPTHQGYREERMEGFRQLLREFDLDGIWIDYHHSHASWERRVPALPDTCFCHRCLEKFSSDTEIHLPSKPAAQIAQIIMSSHQTEWIKWRSDVFTDWVRQFRTIVDEERRGALLGTFHNPWSDTDHEGARLKKLAIDLKAQARYIDVFSPMPYHVRFGHSDTPEWIAQQISWLGRYLGVRGRPGERIQIWPIVQLSDWGEVVNEHEVLKILELGTRPPATGIIVFAWRSLKEQPGKLKELWRFYHQLTNQH